MFAESRLFTAPESSDVLGMMTWGDLLFTNSFEAGGKQRPESAADFEVVSYDLSETDANVYSDESQDEADEQMDYLSRIEAANEFGGGQIKKAVKGMQSTNTVTLMAAVTMTSDEALRLLNLAAAMIQAYVRGFIQRKKYLAFLKYRKAATKIQATWYVSLYCYRAFLWNFSARTEKCSGIF